MTREEGVKVIKVGAACRNDTPGEVILAGNLQVRAGASRRRLINL